MRHVFSFIIPIDDSVIEKFKQGCNDEEEFNQLIRFVRNYIQVPGYIRLMFDTAGQNENECCTVIPKILFENFEKI